MVMLTKAPVAEPHKRSAAESSDCPSKKAARIDDAEEEDGRSEADRARKKANIETLFGRGSRSGGAQTNYVRRESIAPQLFTDVPALCEPFKDPSLVPHERSAASMKKTLGMKIRPEAALLTTFQKKRASKAPVDEEQWEPLLLWKKPDDAGPGVKDIEVDKVLCKVLRPHQREGVKFMFECIMKMKPYDGAGMIMADDMGLGKTLQSIAVSWTCLRQGFPSCSPACKRVIIVCPTSLINNWASEFDKWIPMNNLTVFVISDLSRDGAASQIGMYRKEPRNNGHVLIISYETFRIQQELGTFGGHSTTNVCDLLICDEAHRLKNSETKTSVSLNTLPTARRILLSGTPIQNDLEESFRKHYQNPILRGREPDATEKEVQDSKTKSKALAAIVNNFIIRRTNKILSDHLPPKLVQVVLCGLTPLQKTLYTHFLETKAVSNLLKGAGAAGLVYINNLKKLSNHPKLVYPSGDNQSFAELSEHFPAGYDRSRNFDPADGGKMAVLHQLLVGMRLKNAQLLDEDKEKIVLISNYTSALDIFQNMLRDMGAGFVRLDGSTSSKKRQKMVTEFNDPTNEAFAFLLSSKAGGCGLNLIGASRLVLFDPDWNPANDKQAAARVWRDGQTKRCFIYRFLAAGTIEEKVFQRQLSKEGLSGIAQGKREEETADCDDEIAASNFSKNDLKALFKFDPSVVSTIHDSLKCKRCGSTHAGAGAGAGAGDNAGALSVIPDVCQNWIGTESANGPRPSCEQIQNCAESNGLEDYAHHHSMDSVKANDDLLARAGATGLVKFVFSCNVFGKKKIKGEEGYGKEEALPTTKKKKKKKKKWGGGLDDDDDDDDEDDDSESDYEDEEDGQGSGSKLHSPKKKKSAF